MDKLCDTEKLSKLTQDEIDNLYSFVYWRHWVHYQNPSHIKNLQAQSRQILNLNTNACAHDYLIMIATSISFTVVIIPEWIIYQNIQLYTLNIYNFLFQWYLNKTNFSKERKLQAQRVPLVNSIKHLRKKLH